MELVENESRVMNEELSYSWLDGFNTIFDKVFFNNLGSGVERQIVLSELGVLSHNPDFGNSVPNEAIKFIKNNEGYATRNDALKFALGARAAFKIMEIAYV